MVLVCVEISRWTWSDGRNWRDGQSRVFAGVTDQLRVSPDGRDISVDSLTTQLVIDRCLTHRADTLGLGLRERQHRWCGQPVEQARNFVYRLWMGASDEESDGEVVPELVDFQAAVPRLSPALR